MYRGACAKTTNAKSRGAARTAGILSPLSAAPRQYDLTCRETLFRTWPALIRSLETDIERSTSVVCHPTFPELACNDINVLFFSDFSEGFSGAPTGCVCRENAENRGNPGVSGSSARLPCRHSLN